MQPEPALRSKASLFWKGVSPDVNHIITTTLYVSASWYSDVCVCVSPARPLQVDQKHPTRSGMIPCSWQHRMKLQLFLKASKAYYVLSDAATNLLKYGRALRYIKLSLQCYGGCL